MQAENTAVAVGQVWRRNPPGKERVRVERVWDCTFNSLDESEGYGEDGEAYTAVRAHPLHGGKPLVATAPIFEERYTQEGGS